MLSIWASFPSRIMWNSLADWKWCDLLQSVHKYVVCQKLLPPTTPAPLAHETYCLCIQIALLLRFWMTCCVQSCFHETWCFVTLPLLQHILNPKAPVSCSGQGSAFVRISVVVSSVGKSTASTSRCMTLCLTKWKSTSMCLVKPNAHEPPSFNKTRHWLSRWWFQITQPRNARRDVHAVMV